MANWGDLSYKDRYGRKPQQSAQHLGDLSYMNRYGVPYGQTASPTSGGASAAPSSSASAAGSGRPLDPTYEATIGGLQRKRDDTLSQLSASRPQVLADYGYTTQGYDSSGAPTGLAFDPNNPFSRAALAKKLADQTRSGTQNSMASRGQLYSGALDQAQAGNEFKAQQSNDALLKALTAQLVGIKQRETAANTDYELAAGQADADSLQRAQDTPATPPAAAPAAVAGFTTAAGRDSKGNAGVWHIYPDGRKVFVKK